MCVLIDTVTDDGFYIWGFQSGGQFYPVFTGRLDSKGAFAEMALSDLPGPNFDIVKALNSFAAKGFNPREMVALIGGGHSTGKIHCNFILDRIFNFSNTVKSDPAINAEFLEVLKSECSHPASPSSTTPFENRAMKMDYEGPGVGFGEVYYRSLLQNKGLLFVDQQLTSDERTMNWVESYATDLPQFRRDFGLAMFKLTHIQPPKSEGEVRLDCRKAN